MSSTGATRRLAESELVERYRESGDGRFFEELYQRTRRKVFAVCWRILRDFDRAQDASHEAFLRAYDRFGSLRGTNFSAWICSIAANQSYDELRHRARLETTEDPEDQPLAMASAGNRNPVEREAISKEELERALAIVGSLEPHQRRVFLLRHLDGKSYREIEVDTGYSFKEVKSYLQNARRNFHQAWEGRTRSSGGTPHG